MLVLMGQVPHVCIGFDASWLKLKSKVLAIELAAIRKVLGKFIFVTLCIFVLVPFCGGVIKSLNPEYFSANTKNTNQVF